MNSNPGFPWKVVLIIAAIFIGLCCCLSLVVGAGLYYFSADSGFSDMFGIDPFAAQSEPDTSNPSGAEEYQIPTVIPESEAPDPALEEEEPTMLPKSLTGNQEKTEFTFFDDFSSNALNWDQYKKANREAYIENEALMMRSLAKGETGWIEFPVDFIPYEISFDVKAQSGEQTGTFGVSCNDLGDDDYYYLEFSLADSEYTIVKEENDVSIPLTNPNESGEQWLKTDKFKSPVSSINHIAISCYPTSITLFINDELVDQVEIENPLPEPGTGYFFVYTYKASNQASYKVSFDNVEIFQPVQ